MRYEEIRDDLKDLDIVLFQGKGLISTLIRWFCRLFGGKGRFSHVGVILVDEGRVMLFESTTLNGAKGVRLIPFSEVFEIYEGRVFVRRIKLYPPDFSDRHWLAICDYVIENLDKPYEENLLELMASAVDNVEWYSKDNNSDMFCSELVAGLYQAVGLIPEWKHKNEYTPDDFSIGGQVDMDLRTNQDPACLGEEIEVVK